jgi:hypothetical protein
MGKSIVDDIKKTAKKTGGRQNFKTDLNEIELKYLLGLIAKSEFKGVDLQIIYSITAKIQNKLLK